MRSAIAGVFWVTIAACSAQPVSQADMNRAYVCPGPGLTTVTENGAGGRWKTEWLGADPNEPDTCLIKEGEPGQRRRLVFGRWRPGRLAILTPEEREALHQHVGDFLRGRAEIANFLLRDNGQQVVQFWRVTRAEMVRVGDQEIKALRIRANFTAAANSGTWWVDLWLDPKTNLWIKAVSSLEVKDKTADWTVITIERQPPAQS